MTLAARAVAIGLSQSLHTQAIWVYLYHLGHLDNDHHIVEAAAAQTVHLNAGFG